MPKISDGVREKLKDAVKLWADDNLIDKHQGLASAMLLTIEMAMLKKMVEIDNLYNMEPKQ